MGGDSGATNTANDSDKRGPATDGSDAVGFWEWFRERWICVEQIHVTGVWDPLGCP